MQIDKEIIQTLRLIQQHGFRSAVIAGGAIRDTYFNQLPRDVDIFVYDPGLSGEEIMYPYTGTVDSNFLTQCFRLDRTSNPRRASSDRVTRASNSICSYGSLHGVTSVWDVMKDCVPYQFITLSAPPIDWVNQSFDFGLCKAYYDGEKIRFTSDFMFDMQHKQLTIVGKTLTLGQMVHAIDVHAPRIQTRYPAYTVVPAPWNEKLYTEAKKRVSK